MMRHHVIEVNPRKPRKHWLTGPKGTTSGKIESKLNNEHAEDSVILRHGRVFIYFSASYNQKKD